MSSEIRFLHLPLSLWPSRIHEIVHRFPFLHFTSLSPPSIATEQFRIVRLLKSVEIRTEAPAAGRHLCEAKTSRRCQTHSSFIFSHHPMIWPYESTRPRSSRRPIRFATTRMPTRVHVWERLERELPVDVRKKRSQTIVCPPRTQSVETTFQRRLAKRQTETYL